jgi:hypothetical protein
MLSRFLDDLGVNNNAEIISEIDTDSTSTISSGDTPPPGSHHSSSSNHTPPSGGGDGNNRNPPRRPPRYDDPDPDLRKIRTTTSRWSRRSERPTGPL